MNKLLAGVLVACLILGASGCGEKPAVKTAPTLSGSVETPQDLLPEVTEPVTPETTSSMHAVSMPIVKENHHSQDGVLLFSMTYPQFEMILEDQDLSQRMTASLKEQIDAMLVKAQDIRQAAEEDYQNTDPQYWYAYSLDVSYTPTRLDQNILSLFGNRSRYSGGAHPSWATVSVTYDLNTGKILELTDILSQNYSKDALCALVLEALQEKTQTLSHNYEEIITQRFIKGDGEMPQWYFSRTGLCFHFAPYDIAPYSSGTIIAEIPYENLQGLLNQDYAPVSSKDATGSMYAEFYQKDKTFDFTAPVVLSETSRPIVLYSDAAVTDLRIETGRLLEDSNSFISTGVVFMADGVDIGEAILLSADLSNEDQSLRLVYRSGDHEVSSMITKDPSSGTINLSNS